MSPLEQKEKKRKRKRKKNIDLAVLPSHDIDFPYSLDNILLL